MNAMGRWHSLGAIAGINAAADYEQRRAANSPLRRARNGGPAKRHNRQRRTILLQYPNSGYAVPTRLENPARLPVKAAVSRSADSIFRRPPREGKYQRSCSVRAVVQERAVPNMDARSRAPYR